MKYDFRNINNRVLAIRFRPSVIGLFSMLYFLCSLSAFAQVNTEVDTIKIRIGEQINYKIKVESDSSALVVFPEGQTFMPLESVEALKIDTTKKE